MSHAAHIRIPGLHFHSQLKITEEMESYLLASLEQHGYFARPGANQIMLFGRPRVPYAKQSLEPHLECSGSNSGLPDFLERLVEELEQTLSGPEIPLDVQQKLFSPVSGQARQAILNRYNPGEGIKPHIDLPNRKQKSRRYQHGFLPDRLLLWKEKPGGNGLMGSHTASRTSLTLRGLK